MHDPLKNLADRLQGRNLSAVARRASMARDNVGRIAAGQVDDIYIRTYVKLMRVMDEMDEEGGGKRGEGPVWGLASYFHLYGMSDIKNAYRLRSLAAVQRWRKHPAFPEPVAVYSPSKRPLFDPAAVEAWVRTHRPEYVAQAAGEG